MENKILKNCNDPIDDKDIATKTFVLDRSDKDYLRLKETIYLTKKIFAINFF